MDNILITGANGFIGSHLVEFLVEKDANVYALDIPESNFGNLERFIDKNLKPKLESKTSDSLKNTYQPTLHKRLTLVRCNLLDEEHISEILIEIKPKYIFHLAAQSLVKPSWENPAKTMRINVIGTINIFEPLKTYQLESKVILACTSTEFGTTAQIGRPLKEDDPLLAVHPYGISKVAAELLTRQYFLNFGIKSVNVRFFNQTGPRKRFGAAADFIQRVAQIELGLVEPVLEVGNLNASRDFMGIKDTLQALWLAAEKGTPGETYHACSGEKTHIRDLLNIAVSFSQKHIKVVENSAEKLRKTDENIIVGDNTKITRQLGFKISQPIKEVLKDMYRYWLDYYKRNDSPKKNSRKD